MIRVLLANNHQLLHSGIRAILSTTDDIKLIDSVICDIDSLIIDKSCPIQCLHYKLCKTHNPDVILLSFNNIDLPCENIVNYLAEQCLIPNVLVLLYNFDEIYMEQLMKLEVVGGILIHDPPEQLIEAIREVGQGKPWFSHSLLLEFMRHQNEKEANVLTKKELDVLRLAAAEKTDEEIAIELGIKKRTVRYHMDNINTKLGTSTRTGFVAEALRRKIIR